MHQQLPRGETEPRWSYPACFPGSVPSIADPFFGAAIWGHCPGTSLQGLPALELLAV